MKSLYQVFVGVMLVAGMSLFLESCKPSIPSKYLSQGKMTDILYDIHIAEAMSSEESDGTGKGTMISYREAVLKKHGVTSAEFDSSMVFYMRHTKMMHDIYTDLSDKLTAEAQALGADVNDLNRFGQISSGDTTDIWNGARGFVLSANKPFNYSDFTIPVDTSYQKGDKLMLDFDVQFIYQDGMRDGVVMLAVTFQNDSVASTNMRLTNSQHYSLQIEDRDSLGIKSVKGYFLLNDGDFFSGSTSVTTLKLMFIQNVKLVRLHPRKEPEPIPAPTSVPSDSAVVHRSDSSAAVHNIKMIR